MSHQWSGTQSRNMTLFLLTLTSFPSGSTSHGMMFPKEDRVGMMIKLADTEQGTVHADGTITKSITDIDRQRLEKAREEVIQIMEASDVSGPFVDGMINGGHLGGTVPLEKEDVPSMHPSWLPEDLWVADLSLLPHSQGLPTMLTTSALALRVARRIDEQKHQK